MTRRLLVGYLSLTLLVLVLLEVPLGIAVARYERRDLEARVEHDAVSLASLSVGGLAAGRSLTPVAQVAAAYARRTGGRAVVVDRAGRSVLDTDTARRIGLGFANRPEIATALQGRVAVGTRPSRTAGHDLLFVAVPVASGGVVHGAARITYPTSALDARVHRTWLLLGAGAAVALAAAAVLGLRIARWITRPLAGIEAAAERVGEGELTVRAPESGPPEVAALAQVFNETVAKLETLIGSQDSFVADASHQLRTPLTALRLRLENLAATGAEVDGALVEVERLARLVDDLLALARADSSAEPAAAVDVGVAITERADAWRDVAAEHGVTLQVEIGTAAVGARTARVRLDQVLDNLIDNALVASSAGGQVTLSTVSAEPWVEVHVVDEGPGLTAEQRERAFDRFWRGRTSAGSGLGLAIVARLVGADGGEVQLREAASGGIDAVVRLRPA